MSSLAARICLEACSALHYGAVQRADDNREPRGRGQTVQTTIRMNEAEREAWKAAASTDGRTLAGRAVRRRVGDPTGPASSTRRAARMPQPLRKVQ